MTSLASPSRMTALLTAMSMTLALMPTLSSAATQRFSDVSASARYQLSINGLAEKGVVQGYPSAGSGQAPLFKPNASINRAEFLKIVLESRGSVSSTSEGCFPDVRSSDWFAKYVCTAMKEQIIKGYPDGTFKPEQAINFAEASKIITLAFDQEPQIGGGDWFEQYVLALESSKAIPPTVTGFDKPLNRGEMAEMLWRLIENRTDRETKGFLNIKYPQAAVNFASDDVQQAKSCIDIQALAERSATGQNYYYRGDVMLMEDNAESANQAGTTGAPAPTTGAKSTSGADGSYSETNVQVQGVDEGDSIKTDGEHLFIVRNNEIKILRAKPATDMTVLATVTMKDGTLNPSQIYIHDDTLVVIGQQWNTYPMPLTREKMMIAPDMYPWPGGMSRTIVRTYDVSNPSSPKELREVSFEGNSIQTRRIEDKVYLVLQQPVRWRGPVHIMEEKDLLPVYSDSAEGSSDMPVARCGTVSILPHVHTPEYMTVAVVPLSSPTADVQTDVVMGSAQNVYMSLGNLYVATTEWNYVWDSANPQSNEKTNVYRFAVTNNGVNFVTKGSVHGHILNQFSMDEHEDHFRIATTVSGVWGPRGSSQSSNELHILNMDMSTVGSIEDIAPGETIFSARFMGDRAYMVTFKQVDPLFVIDTSNPRAPKILGKLKIPGYSNYLHPYDENHVLGFGKEVDESIDKDKVHSDDAVYFTAIQGVKVSLFDVTDVANPKERFKEVIGDRGSDSPLLYDHKALLFEKDRGLLAFPVLVTQRKAGDPKSEAGLPVFQGAYVYDVSLTGGFDLRGTITHYEAGTFEKAGDYWYGGMSDLSRIVRIGETLYTLSQDMVLSHDEKSVKFQDEVKFETK